MGVERTEESPRRLLFNGKESSSDDLWPEAILANEKLKSIKNPMGKTLADLLDSVTDDPRTRAYLEAVALSDEGNDSKEIVLQEVRR